MHLRNLMCTKWLRIASALAMAHYLIGFACWGCLIYVTIVPICRNFPAETAATEIRRSLDVFAERTWKCALPLVVAILAFRQTSRRPRLSLILLIAIACFTAIMSYSDISAGRWDFHTFDVEELCNCKHYMTWWWYHDCHAVGE